MDKKELIKALTEHNIPPYYYNLEMIGEKDQRICLDHDNWAVYYSERGKRFDVVEHQTENEAYKDIYSRLIK